MKKEHLVIIGNGMATGRLLSEITALDADRYAITVFDQEPHGSYNRIMLSPVLAEEMTAKEIVIHPTAWFARNNITLHTDDPVISIDRDNQCVTSQRGEVAYYDKLVIATGSEPALPAAVRDCELEGILSFRNMRDVKRIKEQANSSEHALVIGGGLLGLEAAYGLRKQGIDVTVLHRGEWLLNRQLDEAAGKLLQAELKRRGIHVLLDKEALAFKGEGHVSSVLLSDGSELQVQQVVIAIGIVPHAELAEAAGLDCQRGVHVNNRMQTSDPLIFALGECCQYGDDTFGLVAPIWDQVRVLSNLLCDDGSHRFAVNPTATKLKISGIDLYSAGEYLDSEDTDAVVFKDRFNGSYKKLLFRKDRLVGAVMYGDVQDGNWYFDLIQEQQTIRAIRPHIIFGRAFCEKKSADAGTETERTTIAAAS
ncbi:FAD-dependent oxidoreductase [Pontibacterium granulatum]|uniref:NAD(P)/FAD-dependent oxidoreductase n=1 Tax=Pontibacterium granulatum TaxID=2036029 RepID=UPI00249A117D|nr:FAD-dependent oxidoreductase [Pontibacterium granulatum]MDI3325443.1 FAD-dependent oxidoreductase [Pontibacterium granulatum]